MIENEHADQIFFPKKQPISSCSQNRENSEVLGPALQETPFTCQLNSRKHVSKHKSVVEQCTTRKAVL